MSEKTEAEIANLSSAQEKEARKPQAFLQVVPVTLQSSGKRVSTFAFFDSGSTVSFIDKSIKDELKTKGSNVDLNITGINGQYNLKTERISVTVKGSQSPVFTIQPFVHPKKFNWVT